MLLHLLRFEGCIVKSRLQLFFYFSASFYAFNSGAGHRAGQPLAFDSQTTDAGLSNKRVHRERLNTCQTTANSSEMIVQCQGRIQAS
jgi:hypothetical protein